MYVYPVRAVYVLYSSSFVWFWPAGAVTVVAGTPGRLGLWDPSMFFTKCNAIFTNWICLKNHVCLKKTRYKSLFYFWFDGLAIFFSINFIMVRPLALYFKRHGVDSNPVPNVHERRRLHLRRAVLKVSKIHFNDFTKFLFEKTITLNCF